MKEETQESRTGLKTRGAAGSEAESSPEARGLSQTMRDPARRKRNAGHKIKSRCKEGSVEPNGRKSNANGGIGVVSSLVEPGNGQKANGKRNDPGHAGKEPAASDDAGGTTFAGDVASPSAAACTGREACAEVAAPRSFVAHEEESGTEDDRRPRACSDVPSNKQHMEADEKNTTAEHGGAPLALDAPGFVDDMHARVNLYAVGKELLEAGDLKLKQRTWEYLLEMKYGKGVAIPAEEAPRVDFGDLPRPQR